MFGRLDWEDKSVYVKEKYFSLRLTFSHLADALIQSDLQ